jgi:hypothetical protein
MFVSTFNFKFLDNLDSFCLDKSVATRKSCKKLSSDRRQKVLSGGKQRRGCHVKFG